MMEDLELDDAKALGLRIEKCVDEVLRSHLVERPLNTTKNYLPKQKEWKVNQAPPLFSPLLISIVKSTGLV